MKRYVLAVDQSTQGTKGLLFDEDGILIRRCDKAHRQIVNEKGWVSHSLSEILSNTLAVCRMVIEEEGIAKNDIKAFSISNQRETTAAWNKENGAPIDNAIVWQCARAADICKRHQDIADMVKQHTGLNLSPYFPASKIAWFLENIPEAAELSKKGMLAFGTIDSFLIYNLCDGHPHKTDYSNAGRTQLFNINTLSWDSEICDAFGISQNTLPEVCMSDALYGFTDLGGYLNEPIPVHGVLGDSHGALFGQNCRKTGDVKATYGTGSSVMMNIGDKPRFSSNGLVTSLAWGLNGKVQYVFEGNLNYTGAVISWLKKDVGLIEKDADATDMAYKANVMDKTYFVPAFSGLGAPYWDSEATGILTGVTRTTGANEITRACLDCIAYQITDLLELMRQDSDITIPSLRVDGGPTVSPYLMQFQSDMSKATVQVPALQELSGMGAAYAAGIAIGLYDPDRIYDHVQHKEYTVSMKEEQRSALYEGWKKAVSQVLHH